VGKEGAIVAMTVARMRIRKSKTARRFAEEEFLVDSGAAFTVAPGAVLRRLGIQPDEDVDLFLADGGKITRKVGEAYFELGEKRATSRVIFGEEGDSNLLGALTLEAFGLVLDPLKRELRAMRLTLM
jgi:predicted aspartyl protease